MLKTLTFFSFLAFCAANYTITTISEYTTSLGGAPHWDAKRLSLYYIDVFALEYNVLRYDWKEKKIYRAIVLTPILLKAVDFIIPIEGSDDLFAIGVATRTVKIIRWDGISMTAKTVNSDVFTVEQKLEYATNIWHIAKADPKGRFIGGTTRIGFCNSLPTPNASLYKYSKKDGVESIIDGFKATGGMNWDINTNTFYIVDICKNIINAYDWVPETGVISNGRQVFKTHDGGSNAPHHPVSVAIDRNGILYTPMFNDSSIWIIDPKRSKLLKVIEVPTQLIVNVAFGGPDLNVLFVTTASFPLNANTGLPELRQLSPEAGSLFMIEGIGATGYEGYKLAEL